MIVEMNSVIDWVPRLTYSYTKLQLWFTYCSQWWTVRSHLHDTTGCQTGLTTGFDNRFDNERTADIVPDNRFDNRLYRVNGALVSAGRYDVTGQYDVRCYGTVFTSVAPPGVDVCIILAQRIMISLARSPGRMCWNIALLRSVFN